jgi:hypothetical protein
MKREVFGNKVAQFWHVFGVASPLRFRKEG